MQIKRLVNFVFTDSRSKLCILFLLILFLLPSFLFANENNTAKDGAELIQATEVSSEQDIQANSEHNTAPQAKTKTSLLPSRVMPVYGNWCGANHPKDMSIAEEPIDLLDQSCKKHDYCYADEGYLSCACDNVINQELITGLKEN